MNCEKGKSKCSCKPTPHRLMAHCQYLIYGGSHGMRVGCNLPGTYTRIGTKRMGYTSKAYPILLMIVVLRLLFKPLVAEYQAVAVGIHDNGLLSNHLLG